MDSPSEIQSMDESGKETAALVYKKDLQSAKAKVRLDSFAQIEFIPPRCHEGIRRSRIGREDFSGGLMQFP